MTATTETLPAQAPAAPAQQPPKGGDPLGGYGATRLVPLLFGVSGLASWLGGVALHSGYHVNVPFLASWLILFLGHLTVAQAASAVANVWHSHKLSSASALALLTRSGELFAEEYAAQQHLPAAVAQVVAQQSAGIR